MKIRSFKQAIENGFIITSIYARLERNIRVTVERRFYKPDSINICMFWINRKYFISHYRHLAERFNVI